MQTAPSREISLETTLNPGQKTLLAGAFDTRIFATPVAGAIQQIRDVISLALLGGPIVVCDR